MEWAFHHGQMHKMTLTFGCNLPYYDIDQYMLNGFPRINRSGEIWTRYMCVFVVCTVMWTKTALVELGFDLEYAQSIANT